MCSNTPQDRSTSFDVSFSVPPPSHKKGWDALLSRAYIFLHAILVLCSFHPTFSNSFPFCALSQGTLNLIIPGTEMRQNVNSTVITTSHQSVLPHDTSAAVQASSLSSAEQLTALHTLLLQMYTHSPHHVN